MVAPIDAKASFEAEGETITLRLNFRSLALAEAEGIDLFRLEDLTATKIVALIRCLAVSDHPEMDNDEALAIFAHASEQVVNSIRQLLAAFGGKASAGGNVRKPKPKA